MKIAVYSDIHANVERLEKGLADMRAKGADQIWCLGDIVGYGHYPAETVALVRKSSDLVLAGNHDYAATGRFNEFLDFIPTWLKGTLVMAQDKLGEDDYRYLTNLKAAGRSNGIEIFHGSRDDPVSGLVGAASWEHVLNQDTYLSLVGHTHTPLAIGIQAADVRSGKEKDILANLIFDYPEDKVRIDLTRAARWVLNPGTLGLKQYKIVPDRKPGWMMLEGDSKMKTATWYRV